MVRLTDRPDMTLDVYRGRKTTTQQQPAKKIEPFVSKLNIRRLLQFESTWPARYNYVIYG